MSSAAFTLLLWPTTPTPSPSPLKKSPSGANLTMQRHHLLKKMVPVSLKWICCILTLITPPPTTRTDHAVLPSADVDRDDFFGGDDGGFDADVDAVALGVEEFNNNDEVGDEDEAAEDEDEDEEEEEYDIGSDGYDDNIDNVDQYEDNSEESSGLCFLF